MDEIGKSCVDSFHDLEGRVSMELIVEKKYSPTDIPIPYYVYGVVVRSESQAYREVVYKHENALFVSIDDALSCAKATRSRHRWVCDSLFKKLFPALKDREGLSQHDFYWDIPLDYFSNKKMQMVPIHPENGAFIFANLLSRADDLRNRLDRVGRYQFDRVLHEKLMWEMFGEKYELMPYESFRPRREILRVPVQS